MEKLKILYVSVTGRRERPYSDPSARYRCFYQAESLRRIGHYAWVTSHSRINDIDPTNFDVIVVHRPVFEPDMLDFIEKAILKSVRLVADYDDLIFNPRFAKQSSIYKNSFDLNNSVAIFRKNTDALKLFNYFTVSTENLGGRINEIKDKAAIFHYPNSLPASFREFIDARVFQSITERKYIGYFPGTKTHDIDFRECEEYLFDYAIRQDLPILIVGPLSVNHEMSLRANIVRRDPVQFEDMFKLLAECKVVIAPLEASPFNDAKSHIKLMEGSLTCCSVVYSNIPDMQQHNHIAPYYINNSREWFDALKSSWEDFSVDANNKISEYFKENFDNERQAAAFVNFIS